MLLLLVLWCFEADFIEIEFGCRQFSISSTLLLFLSDVQHDVNASQLFTTT